MTHRRAAWEWRTSGPSVLVPELRAIAASRAAVEHAEAQLRAAVVHARREGFSWEHVALPLGVTRQTAWERWRSTEAGPAPAEPALPAVAVPKPPPRKRKRRKPRGRR